MPTPRPLRRVLAPVFLLACALGATGTPHAQQPAPPASRPAAGGTTGGASGTSAPATAPERSLELHVGNLSADTAPQIRGRLLALEYPVFSCTACKLEQAVAGECPTCKQPLRRDARALLRTAVTDVEARAVRCTWLADHAVRWSEIETQLTGLGLSFDAARLAIPGDVELVIAHSRASLLPEVERAINDSKLFASATVRWDAERREMRIATRAAARAPSRADLLRAIQPTGGSLRDVIWPAVPAAR
jgi:hypothetical protein